MRQRHWSGLVRLVMAGALVGTGVPLLQPWLPSAPPPVLPSTAGGQTALPDRIAVDAKDSLTPAQLAALNARYGLSLSHPSVHAQDEQLLVSRVAPTAQQSVLDAMAKDPLVEAAAPLYVYTLPREVSQPEPVTLDTGGTEPARGKTWTPNDPRFADQWHMKMVGAEKAWGMGARGKGVTVAVIDTGVAWEDDEKCYRAKDFHDTSFTKGYDFVNNDAHPNDDHGHGTHVAGTIAESTNNSEGAAGLAFEATVMPIKVLDAFGSGTSAAIADGIRYAADHGAKVINLSLGGPFPDPIMRLACKYAARKGVLVVCAAGNSFGGPVGYPAGFPECLAVSSVGPKGEIAPYSSIGKQVGIAGPGGDKSQGDEFGVLQNTVLDGMKGDGDGYYSFQGTSMASPHVAATAALIMSRGVTDAGKVKQLLQRAATPKKPAEKYGAGILNASKSVELADTEKRDSWLKLLVAGFAGLAGLGLRAGRGAAAGAALGPLGFVLGFAGPDLALGWLGHGTAWSLLFHSALIPLYLLWEVEGRLFNRVASAVALGAAGHLAWEAVQGGATFAGVLPGTDLPWMWVNVVVALGTAVVAYRRSYAAE